MQDYGNKEKFSIELAREELATNTKKYWDTVVLQEIDRYAKDHKLNQEQIEELTKRKMIETLYLDLDAKNQYMARTNDEFAVRAIRRNKEKMYELNSIYKQFDEKTKQRGQEVGERIETRLSEQQNKKTNNTKKAA